MTPVTLVSWAFAPDWLTVPQAAWLSGLGEALLLDLVSEGALEAERNGATWLIDKASLSEFQEALFDVVTLSA